MLCIDGLWCHKPCACSCSFLGVGTRPAQAMTFCSKFTVLASLPSPVSQTRSTRASLPSSRPRVPNRNSQNTGTARGLHSLRQKESLLRPKPNVHTSNRTISVSVGTALLVPFPLSQQTLETCTSKVTGKLALMRPTCFSKPSNTAA